VVLRFIQVNPALKPLVCALDDPPPASLPSIPSHPYGNLNIHTVSLQPTQRTCPVDGLLHSKLATFQRAKVRSVHVASLRFEKGNCSLTVEASFEHTPRRRAT
jgi:hypothetical protein